MARYNEILVGRYNRFLQKLFGMKGGAPAPQLSSDVQTVLQLFSGVEHRYLEGWDRFGLLQNVPAVALNTSGVRFRNPAVSNVVAVFEKIVLTGFIVSVTLAHGTAIADLATAGLVNTRLDPRGRAQSTVIETFQNNAVAVPGLTNTVNLYETINNTVAGAGGEVSDVILTINQEIPLLPGDALQATADGVNAQINVAAIWRERLLEESERT